jgi:hypothetical protein
MAVWFIEGFDHYVVDTFVIPPVFNSGADVLRKWTGTLSTFGTGPNSIDIKPTYARQQPGQGAQITGGGGLYKTRPGANVDTFIMGVATMFVSQPPSGLAIFGFYDITNEQISVRADGSGHLIVSRNGTTLATSTNVISLNTWYYMELKSKIHPSAGTYELRVNGSSVGWVPAATGANTRATANSYATGIFIRSANSAYNAMYMDDIYAADNTGATNNDFLGPQVVVAIRPAGVGSNTQWTPNGGSNFGNVNEIYPDSDMTFNMDTTAGHIDTFNMVELPFSSGVITAIQHVIYAKQDAGAQRVICPFERGYNASANPGNSVNLSTSYQYILEPKDGDPVTSAAFTIAHFNDAEFGYKLVS